jgi:plasmid stability protein
MARTTFVLDDDLLRELKKKAAAEGYSLQRLTNDLLRRALSQPREHSYRLRLRGWKATEQPGVDLLDRDKLFDLMGGR